jgi:hypothetical protein
MIKFIGLLILSFSVQVSYADDLPDFSANYLVRLNGIQAGELKRSLTSNADGTRLFTSTSQAKGMFSFFKPDIIVESSAWTTENNQILPLNYVYERTGGKKEKFMHLNFDWQQSVINIDDHVHPWILKIEQPTLDKLIYQIALMADLSRGKQSFSYQIADGGKIKTYTIKIIGKEMITTPLGKINTVVLTRERERENDRNTTLWCAPELHYLPVQLEHTEKSGARFTAVLRKLDGIKSSNAFVQQATQKSGFMQ